jgi:hypothetical protein
MSKTFYLTNTTNNALPGTAPSEYDISVTSAAAGTIGPVAVGNLSSRISRWWNVPGVYAAGSGQYSVEIDLTVAAANLTVDVDVQRWNSSGVLQNTINLATGAAWTTAGVKTYQATDDLGAFAVDDYFVVEVEVHSSKEHGGAAEYTLSVNDADAEVITPWTDPPVTITGTGSRSKITSAVGQLDVQSPLVTINGIGSRSKTTAGVGQITFLPVVTINGIGSRSKTTAGVGELTFLPTIDISGIGSRVKTTSGVGQLISPGTPLAVTDLAGTPGGSGEVTLTWSAPLGEQ